MIYLLIFYIFAKCIVILSSSVPSLSDDFISSINNENHTWKAGRNFPANTSINTIQRLTGTMFDDLHYSMMAGEDFESIPNLPKIFDSRKQWSNCPSINEVRNQGACANCWAVAAVSTMTDRFCICSKEKHHFHFSTSDLVSCCINYGCSKGGYASLAWQYWKRFGIVSGGEYNTNMGCKPYQFPPCDHNTYCRNLTVTTPNCLHECTPGFHKSYLKDKRFAKEVYAIKGGEEQIKAEIYKNGPVEAVFKVFTDFLVYKRGVYQHVKGTFLGSHAVKIIGWGVEYGFNYWLVVNTWGKEWGDEGLFKILRGVDHCHIESLVLAGEPSYHNHTQRAAHLNMKLFKNVEVEFQWPR